MSTVPSILWQSMKIQYFAKLLQQPRLTLQRLHDKPDNKESRMYDEIANNICKHAEKAYYPVPLINALEKSLPVDLKKIARRLFFCCFYDVETPDANLLTLFGGDSGVSVGFNKEMIKRRCLEEKCLLPKQEFLRYGSIDYITGSNEELDKRVGEFLKLVDWATDISYYNTALQQLVAEYMFQKSKQFENENEFRIVFGAESALAKLRPLKIELSDISAIAVSSAGGMGALLPHLCSGIIELETSCQRYNHPLVVYRVVAPAKN